MKKIPTIYLRNHETGEITDDEDPYCDWVFTGEGHTTEKIDGTCCLICDNRLFKRRTIPMLGEKPKSFIPVDKDLNTGKIYGWMPVSNHDPADQWHVEAFKEQPVWSDGTYELIGFKVQGNPYKIPQYRKHMLMPHGAQTLDHLFSMMHVNKGSSFARLTKDDLCKFLSTIEPRIEGIVWHHPDGRMAKIKSSDLGIQWRFPGGPRIRGSIR